MNNSSLHQYAADASAAGIGIPIDIAQAIEAARITQAFIEHSRERLRRDPRLLAAIVDDMAGKLFQHRSRGRRLPVRQRGPKRPTYRERTRRRSPTLRRARRAASSGERDGDEGLEAYGKTQRRRPVKNLRLVDPVEQPALLIQKRRPVIYFAGKISQADWRNTIVGDAGVVNGSCYINPEDYPAEIFDPSYTVDCGAFIYGGPYFISCDHACHHGPNSHGVNEYGVEVHVGDTDAFEQYGMSREEIHRAVFDVNFERIKRADYVFAYLNELDAFGTLIEIGHAQAWGKQLVVGFGPKIKPDQLWMACERAIVFRGSAREVWRKFCGMILADWIVETRLTAVRSGSRHHET